MKSRLIKVIIVVGVALRTFSSEAQTNGVIASVNPIDTAFTIIDSSVIRKYSYIQFAQNKIIVPPDKTSLLRFHEKFDSLSKFHDRQLVIYHFGGSHIQADVYSGRIRNALQNFSSEMKGPRGWIFPYSAVGTNNPRNYRLEYSGKWSGVRCPVKKDSAKTLGMMGISATTKESIAYLKMYRSTDEPQPYRYTRLRVYYNLVNTNYTIQVKELGLVGNTFHDRLKGFTEFDFTTPLDTVNLVFSRSDADTTRPFTLYGIVLMNDEPGIIYNSIGVNGAGFESYERCQLFAEQLGEFPPDLVIISIGTNDANDKSFTTTEYARNYVRFADEIRRVNPDCAFIFTVPNDNYVRYRYPQKNIDKCRNIIYQLAEKYGAGVWDFYTIMGGLGSSQKWYKDHLMIRDRIHFTREGYLLKGELFYDAFLKWYREFNDPEELQLNKN